ncbi:MAG: DUF1559 domain-containing protein [Gemmataceae bacterium]
MNLWLHRLIPLAVPLLLAAPLRAGDAVRPDLAAVPGNALGFVHVRVAELWKSDAFKDLRGMVEKAGSDALAAFDKRFVPAPSSIDRLTVVILMPDGGTGGEPPLVAIISTSAPFDDAKLVKAALSEPKEEKAGEKRFYTDMKTGVGLQVIDKQTFAFGPIDAMRHYVGERSGGSGAFELALKDAGKHQITAALNSSLLPAEAIGGLPPSLQPLARARLIQASVDIDREIRLGLALKFADDDAAKAGEESAKEGLKMAREALAGLHKEVESKLMPKVGPKVSPIAELPEAAVALVALGSLKQADEILKDLPMKRDGTALAVAVTVPAGPYTAMLSLSGFSAAALLPAVQKVRMSAGRARSANNLKQMAIAMHNYHDVHGKFPSAAICDKNGKPLLSWRVAILPYVEQDNLYKQFHLDEPWDSDHNKKLLAQMPPVYALPGVNQPGDTTTHYRVFVDNGAGFDLRKGTRIMDITDGTSNTIMIAEAADAVPWSKPEELEFDPSKPLPKLGKMEPSGFHVAMFDGSVRFISHGISPQTLKAAITRAGGEVLGPDF